MGSRADYGSTPSGGSGGLVAVVDTGSPAARAGLAAGDTITAVGGEALHDVIDWQWETDAARITLTVTTGAGTTRELELAREAGEAWGVGFAEPLFDPVRTCRNACMFCFMSQLPRGLRRSLYVRDDDFRLSFLFGNFITLTNLTDEDVARIAEQALSPLYVSLHAVDAAARAQLICAREDTALVRFDELLDAGIDLHVQIVLVPGVNDGARLEETLEWLAAREGVGSVGVVPLGYTAHQSAFVSSYESPAAAAAVIDQLRLWQEAFRKRDGITWVHAADEFYLNAGRELPVAAFYDGFPQYENGIGLVRSFAEEFAAGLSRNSRATAADSRARTPDRRPTAIVTGTLFAPVLEALLRDAGFSPEDVRVLPVANRFFGGNVGVTGLLTARDIAEALSHDVGLAARYLVPDIVFNADGLTLDDVDQAGLRERSLAELAVVSCDAAGLLEALTGGQESHPERP